MPALSVLLPVRNARPWLARSLDSLWRQSFRDFDVIAVDDGSSDGSAQMLEDAAGREPRLTVVRTPGRGLPATLNLALAASSAPILVRMDADDLVSRNRFALLHAHLAAHPETAVVGSRVRLFPNAAVGAGMRRWITWHNALLTHEAMAREALIDSPLVHGTAMLRREWLERIGGWTSRPWPEDLDLWIRLIDAGARLDKRPETLYAWRQHPASATRSDPRYQREQFDALKLDTLDRWLVRDHSAPHVLGVGTSLERWYDMLVARHPQTRAIESRSPRSSLLATLTPPIVLVLVAYQRRDLWRQAMLRHGFQECRDFIFVA